LVFGERRRSSSFSHPFCHWNYSLRLFYSIESTAVIPVNLKIVDESTVLSRGELVQKSAEIERKPGIGNWSSQLLEFGREAMCD
jgi:hypothetical protein